MDSKTTIILAAAGALLIGSAATATLMHHQKQDSTPSPSDVPAPVAATPSGKGLEYAQVLNVNPITQKTTIYGTITGIDPIEQPTSGTSSRRVCHDVVFQRALPERDANNVGGTIAGAVIGGLAGSRFGGGHGRNAATVAGTLAGGFLGNHIERAHKEHQAVNEVERLCHTETVPTHSSVVKGYTVNYRKDDGSTGSLQMDAKPTQTRVDLGQVDQAVGFDVTYLYNGHQQTARLAQRPASDKLPLIDGQLVTAVAPTPVAAPSTASAEAVVSH